MTDNDKKFDEDIDLKVSDRLSEDLKGLFKPEGSVPPEVDRYVLGIAGLRLHRRGTYRLLRWAASAAAVAAAVIFVFIFNTAKQADRTAFDKGVAYAQTDIDRSGRVDILDAFKLARQIETNQKLGIKWDFNKDGFVDSKDVDVVAMAAVRLDKGV